MVYLYGLQFPIAKIAKKTLIAKPKASAMPNVGAVGDKPVGIHHSSIQVIESPQLHLLAMGMNLSHKLAVDALPHAIK